MPHKAMVYRERAAQLRCLASREDCKNIKEKLEALAAEYEQWATQTLELLTVR